MPRALAHGLATHMARHASSRRAQGSFVSVLEDIRHCLTVTGPLQGAKPNIGKVGDLEHVSEHKVEMVIFGKNTALGAVETLKKTHPYEVVAYSVVKAEDF
jgi:hypothetical protein